MADELQYYGNPGGESGLTVVARVYDSTGSQVGSDAACAEVGTLAIYIGDMPPASAGTYGIRFFNGSDLLGQGQLFWDGSAEVDSQTIDDEIGGLNNLSASQVNSEVTVALNAYDPPTNAELTAAVAPLSTQASVDVIDANVDAVFINTNTTLPNQIAALPAPLDSAATQAAVEAGISAQEPIDANVTQVSGSSVAGVADFQADTSALATSAALLASPPVIATEVRNELATELGRIDVPISSRESETDASSRAVQNQSEHDDTQISIAGLNDLSASEVNAQVLDVFTTYDPPTKGELDAAEANIIAASGGGGLDAAGVRSAIGLSSANLDTQLSGIDSAIGSLNDLSAGDVRSELATELGRIDVAISSRESEVDASNRETAIIAAVNSGLTIVDVQTALTAQGYTTGRAAALDNLDAAITTRSASGDAMGLTAGALASIRNLIIVFG